MIKLLIFPILIVLLINCSSTTLAQEQTEIPIISSDTTDPLSTTDINSYIQAAPDLNTINQGVSAFNSSFSGYSSFGGSQCGLSISGGYINNGYQDGFQMMTTFNTNPCTNQKDLENLRQVHETQREVIRGNTQIMTTCINARMQVAQNHLEPDSVCKLSDFQMLKNP